LKITRDIGMLEIIWIIEKVPKKRLL